MKHGTTLLATLVALTCLANPAGGQWFDIGSIIYTWDRVGIGTNTPDAGAALQVRANQSSGSFAAGGVRIDNGSPPANGERTVLLSLKNNQTASGQDWTLSNIGNSPGRGGNFEIRQIGPGVSNVNRLTITPTGNVGLGTTTPGEQLTVTGCMRFDNAGTGNVDIDLCNDDSSYNDDGVTLRTTSNPPNGEPIFRVLSSGGSERLSVEHSGRLYTSNVLHVAATGESFIAGSLKLNGNLIAGGDICIGNC